jgi:hypothetical protein
LSHGVLDRDVEQLAFLHDGLALVQVMDRVADAASRSFCTGVRAAAAIGARRGAGVAFQRMAFAPREVDADLARPRPPFVKQGRPIGCCLAGPAPQGCRLLLLGRSWREVSAALGCSTWAARQA